MDARRTKYLRVPSPRPHQIADILTSLDEALREVIVGLDMIIQHLSTITGRPSEQVAVPPTPVPAIPRIVSLPYPVDIVGAVEVEVTEKAKSVQLAGDIIVLTADSDIRFGKRVETMYPLWAGTYFVMARSDTLNEIYIQSLAGTARAYILMLAITG